jgi:hypothetical protein
MPQPFWLGDGKCWVGTVVQCSTKLRSCWLQGSTSCLRHLQRLTGRTDGNKYRYQLENTFVQNYSGVKWCSNLGALIYVSNGPKGLKLNITRHHLKNEDNHGNQSPTFIPWYKNDRMLQHHARLPTSSLLSKHKKRKKRCLANFKSFPSQS